MLKGPLIHPPLLRALARCGHGSTILIADGNYPFWNRRGSHAEVVCLNVAPGLLSGTDVLSLVKEQVPIEAARVMEPQREGPYAMEGDPPIFDAFRDLLADTDCRGRLEPTDKFEFYELASDVNHTLTIATGEQRIYANLLLTTGVVRAASET